MNLWKINIPKSIILITILAVVFNLLRIVIWGKISFIYILWNIFLALVPFIISSFVLVLSKERKLNKLITFVGIFLWLIFIPNSPYIITDFIHLGTTRSIPVIYDILLLFSSAVAGLLLFFHSVFHIEQIFKMKYTKKVTSVIMTLFIIIISFGIYLGRFLRFNSWDIFTNHSSLVNSIWKIISQAAIHTEVYLYTGLFFFFLYISYSAWKYSNLEK